jgi:hypothetical protein
VSGSQSWFWIGACKRIFPNPCLLGHRLEVTPTKAENCRCIPFYYRRLFNKNEKCVYNVVKRKHRLQRQNGLPPLLGLKTSLSSLLDYMTNVKENRIFFVVHESDGQLIVSIVHGFEQLDSIFILLSDRSNDQEWSAQYNNVKVF